MATDVVKAFKDGVLKIKDGNTTTPQETTIKMGEGGLSYTESEPKLVKKDRGALDHARSADQEPLSWTIEAEFRGYAGTGVSLYEALTGTGGASAWASDEPNSDIHAVILELTITDPGDASTETITIARAFYETGDLAEATEGDTLSFSGRAMVVRPTFA